VRSALRSRKTAGWRLSFERVSFECESCAEEYVLSFFLSLALERESMEKESPSGYGTRARMCELRAEV
jgi:hypothetical protein